LRRASDLTCLGIIGSGCPSVLTRRRDLMEQVSPLARLSGGTLSGNPLAVAAGLATLRALTDEAVYRRLEALGARLEAGLRDAAARASVPLTVNRVGSMLTGFFTGSPVVDLASAKRSDTARYARFFHGMLERGVFLAASQFEAAFVSLAHTDDDIEAAAQAARETLKTIA
jgi:glutamate-1-semialdehyde 2,1-aminomutase